MTQTSPAAARQLDAIPVHRKSLSQRLRENWQLYVMLLIPVVLTIVYKYWPMYGIQIAFRDFKASRGITGSEWVGLYWFERFFTAPNCVRMIKNTVLLSLYSLLWSFPIPIILSLCINQLRFAKFKRVVQTVLYAPHFISTMVICGMIKIFLSPSGGLLNLILGTSVDFLSESTAFRTIYVASGIWQEAGWGTIIYMACLAAVDTSLYEAAKIDGASMFQRILHIDIPELVPMIVLQLIMSVGNLMNVGFEKVLLLQTELNKATSDIIAVYVYEQGIINAKYSYSTAVGLFNTVVNIILLRRRQTSALCKGGEPLWQKTLQHPVKRSPAVCPIRSATSFWWSSAPPSCSLWLTRCTTFWWHPSRIPTMCTPARPSCCPASSP